MIHEKCDITKYGIIYKIVRRETGKTYVGAIMGRRLKNWNRRWDQKSAYYGSGHEIEAAIEKYGRKAFDKFVIRYVDNEDEKEKWETYYIAKLKTLYPNGYNLESGGKKDKVVHKLTKVKMSGKNNPMFGKKRPEHSGVKSGENHPMYGKTHTGEWKAAHSARMSGENNPRGFLGKHHTDESRAKQSAANSGENHPMFGKKWTPERRAKYKATRARNKKAKEAGIKYTPKKS